MARQGQREQATTRCQQKLALVVAMCHRPNLLSNIPRKQSSHRLIINILRMIRLRKKQPALGQQSKHLRNHCQCKQP